MDSLGDLVPFAIAAAYLALRFVRRQRPAAAPAAPRALAPRPTTGGPTPFEQLLARLEAASEAAGEPSPPPSRKVANARHESAIVEQERAARAATEARTEEAVAFHSTRRAASGAAAHVGMSAQHGFEHEAHDFDLEARGFEHERKSFEHDRHGFEDANPYSEEALERARDADLRPRRTDRLDYNPHGRPAPPPSSRPAPLAAQLRSAESVRDAFVLATVLDRRPRRRPR